MFVLLLLNLFHPSRRLKYLAYCIRGIYGTAVPLILIKRYPLHENSFFFFFFVFEFVCVSWKAVFTRIMLYLEGTCVGFASFCDIPANSS